MACRLRLQVAAQRLLARTRRAHERARRCLSSRSEPQSSGDGTGTYLRELRVKDFALVDSLTVQFCPGLNVITGASGSGKSLLVDAVAQLCGAPVLEEHVRPPAAFAVLEAVFNVGSEHQPAVSALLQDAAPVNPGTLHVQRELHSPPSGGLGTRSVCRVNGKTVPLRLLRALGSVLVDVNGQGAVESLCEPSAVLTLLDARTGTGAEAARFGAALVWARAAAAEAAALTASAPATEAEAEALSALVDEVDAAEVQPGEDTAIKARLRAYEARRAAVETCAGAVAVLDEGVSGGGRAASRDLRAVASKLRAARATAGGEDEDGAESSGEGDDDEEAAEEVQAALESLASALALVDQAHASASRAASLLAPDERQRDEDSARLKTLERLCRKHGARSCDALLEAAEAARTKLGGSGDNTSRLEALRKACEDASATMASLGVELGRRRRAAAGALEAEVDASLARLGMAGARLRVALEWEEAASEAAGVHVPSAGDVGLAPAAYEPTATGFDRARLLLSTAPGEPLRPLSATVSGGERARVVLALKAAATSVGPPVALFDEVDAGVGGATGLRVGASLRALATHSRQVLSVTHLPQVAAYAERHLSVDKHAGADGRVTSRVRELGGEAERAAELGVMLGLHTAAGEELLRGALAEMTASAQQSLQVTAP